MTNLRSIQFLFLAIILFSTTFLQAQNWPNWRGPNGDGTSSETNLPTEWDAEKNVIWKSEVPGAGYSSPVIWGDKLFLTSALLDAHERVLLCYDANSGELLWQKTILKTALEGKHNDNSYASGTPATDGKIIYLSFLDGEDVVVYAYDFSGNKIWEQRPGKFSSPHGYSCSPALYNDKIIINGNSLGDSFLAALNKADGKLIWKVNHENPAHSFTTPIFREMAGKMQMIFGGNKQIISYNPDDGSPYWYINGPSEDFCSTPVYNKKSDMVLISSAWPQRVLMAIKPDGSGDVSESKVVWQTKEGAFYVPSPVCTDDYLFSTMTNGKVHCIEIATGKILWAESLGKQYSSPVLAGGLVYMPNDDGVITVIKPGPAFEVVSKNPIGERMNASPAISRGRIYLRGDKHLFCIGESGSSQGLKSEVVPFSELDFTDVGAATKAGKAIISENKMEVVAGGADIWGTHDEFRFGYQKMSGDFDVSVQVLELSKAHQYTKAGIMARENLDTGSRHVYFQVFPDNSPRNKNNGGCEFQYRLDKDGEMKAIYPNRETAGNKFDVNFPNTFIRLKRTGDIFESYICSDNKSWNLYSAYTQKLPAELLVGIAVTSHNTDVLTTSGFANFQFNR